MSPSPVGARSSHFSVGESVLAAGEAVRGGAPSAPQQLLSLIATCSLRARRAPLPHGHQRGRGPHRAGQSDRQVPPAAVAQRELDLDVLQRADALGPPQAEGNICRDGELGADVPTKYKREVRASLPAPWASCPPPRPPSTAMWLQQKPCSTDRFRGSNVCSCKGHSMTLLRESPCVSSCEVRPRGYRPLPGGVKSLDRTPPLSPGSCPRLGHLHQQTSVQEPVAIVVAH